LIALLGPLTKLAALLPVPFLFVWAWRRQQEAAARRLLLAGTVAGGLVLAAIAFVPFGSPFALVQRLASEATENVGYSPTVALWLVLDKRGQAPAMEGIDLLATGLFVGVAAWLLWRTWRGREALRSAADVFFAYLATSLTFRIWYSIWPFPWLLLERQPGRRLVGGLTFLLAAQLSVVVYGHIRVFCLPATIPRPTLAACCWYLCCLCWRQPLLVEADVEIRAKDEQNTADVSPGEKGDDRRQGAID
jgi:hypothetical protein